MAYYFFYNVLLTVTFWAALPLVPGLFFFGPRVRAGLFQRFGFYPRAIRDRLAGSGLIWLHAASVGEVRSTEPLINELKSRMPGRKVMVSTFTASGNRVAQRIPSVDGVIFLPLDLPWIMRRTLKRFDPALLIVVETEIWPNLLREAHRRGVPTLLVSGRLSSNALRRYSRFRAFFRRVLGYFSAMGMQSSEDAERILALGADRKRVSIVGSLKFAASAPAQNGGRWGEAVAEGKQWLVAASTHRGEEEILLQVFNSLRPRFPNLAMILAPRHPERFDEVEKLLKGSEWKFHRRSQTDGRELFTKDILLLDTVGELVDFFAVGEVVFVGGSLVDSGGHNLLEPARWRKPILFGPFMANFQRIAEEFLRAGAAIEVRSGELLSSALGELLGNSARRQQMGASAAQIACAKNDAFANNWLLTARYL